MPIPLLPLHLHVGVPPPSHDGAITLDRQVLLQIEELISRHVPGMSVAFSVASIVVVCGGYTNKCPPPSTPVFSFRPFFCAGSKTPCPPFARLRCSNGVTMAAAVGYQR